MSRDPSPVRHTVPGRVNIIGEHTDYNDGLALPFATDLSLTVAATSSDRDDVCVRSREFGTWCTLDSATELWMRQARAVVDAVTGRGVEMVIDSDIPAGAGLSSSAAFVVAVALALGHHDEPRAFATLMRDCEVTAGNNVGLLDPLAVLAGRRDHALLIDFRTLAYEHIAIPRTFGFTVVDSGISRALADTAYVQRRDECAAARRVMSTWPPDVSDVDHVTHETLRRRVRHIATENERVKLAVRALRAQDLHTFGDLVDASHASLRDDFDVSLPAIDDLVDRLRGQPGVWGARLMGGGFGGCVLVVHDGSVDVDPRAQRAWRVRPSDGALARLGRG